jgi:O-antigen ligase
VVPQVRLRRLIALDWGGPAWALAWGLAAAVLGAAAALLPLRETAALLAVLAVFCAALAEPLIGLGVTLIVAPFAAVEAILLPGVLPLDSGQLLLGLTLVAWLGRIALRRELRIPRLPVLPALLLFIGALWLSLPRAPSQVWGQNEIIKWGQVALLMLLVVDLASDRRRLAWVVGMLVAAGVVQALIGVYQFGLAGDGPPAFMILGRFYRAYGTFQQPNPFAGFVAMMLALAVGTVAGLTEPVLERPVRSVLGWLGRYRGKGIGQRASGIGQRASGFGPQASGIGRQATGSGRQATGSGQRSSEPAGSPDRRCPLPAARSPFPASRVMLLGACVAAALLAAALVMSWSRGAWFGFAAAGGAMLLLLPRRWWLGPVIAALVLAAGVGLWSAGAVPASIAERLTGFGEYLNFYDVRGVNINDANFAVVERLAHWQAGLSMWQENFWFGVGIGNYQPAYPQYRLLNWELPLGHAHNIYINFGAETGLVGLAAYLIFWGVVIWQTLRALRRLRGPWRGVALGLLGAWVHLSVHHVFDNLYVDNVHLHIGVMLGVLSVLASTREGPACRSLRPVR